jgi:uncharacterized membrane protein
MTTSAGSAPPAAPVASDIAQPTAARQLWLKVRNRILEGMIVVLPFLITFWAIRWLYAGLEQYVIEPLAMLVLWKGRVIQGEAELPYWFEHFGAPIISLIVVVAILYVCGALAHSRLRKTVDNAFLRIPLVSQIYEAAQGILQCFDKPSGQSAGQRVVLVPFPNTGMRAPGIVTSTCIDVATGKTLLCVYIPTAPVPGSGFVLIVPEEEATELNWDLQQTLQAIFSGGLTAPREVNYSVAASVAAHATPPSAGQRIGADGAGHP